MLPATPAVTSAAEAAAVPLIGIMAPELIGTELIGTELVGVAATGALGFEGTARAASDAGIVGAADRPSDGPPVNGLPTSSDCFAVTGADV